MQIFVLLHTKTLIMKPAFLIFGGAVFSTLLHGQVSIQNNIPPVIEPDKEITLEVKINKGTATNFAQYQLDVPDGVVVKEDNNRGGTFAFESNHAKILWPDIQADPEITVSMKLLPGSYAGQTKITQRFSYMENGEKKEFNPEPIEVNFKGNGARPAAAGNQQQGDNDVNKKLQAEQLKRDSKDAYQTGLKEKQAAEKKIAEANAAIKKAQSISNEEEKQAALQKANESKQKAETDKAVASKILALAKSLDDNANEIEHLTKTSPAGTTGNNSGAASATAVPDNGTVYRLQLGAFSQNPEKALNRHMGTISIVNEDGMYKVLMGKFATREEAVKRRDELIARKFECFIVTYKDGVRVR